MKNVKLVIVMGSNFAEVRYINVKDVDSSKRFFKEFFKVPVRVTINSNGEITFHLNYSDEMEDFLIGKKSLADAEAEYAACC